MLIVTVFDQKLKTKWEMNYELTNYKRKKNEKEIVASMHERNDAISTNWTKTIYYKISKIVWKWYSTLVVYNFVNCREKFSVTDVWFQT